MTPSNFPPSDLPPSDLPPSNLPPSDLPPSNLPRSRDAFPQNACPDPSSDRGDFPDETLRDRNALLGALERREWLLANGIGGYACGTAAGMLTRCYHGLLVAALDPPLGRTVLLTKLEETVETPDGRPYDLSVNRWADGTVAPRGDRHLVRFEEDETRPVWTFACGAARLEKRLWMLAGRNATVVRYALHPESPPVSLTLRAIVDCRDHHGRTQAGHWTPDIDWDLGASEVSLRRQAAIDGEPAGGTDGGTDGGPDGETGCARIVAFPGAPPLYLHADRGRLLPARHWWHGFDLAVERYRGLDDRLDGFHALTIAATLQPGQAIAVTASADPPNTFPPDFDAAASLETCRSRDRQILHQWETSHPDRAAIAPDWVRRLVLAADRFLVDRPLPDGTTGKTAIAGYPWFGDWGRDTAIALPGLAIATGRYDDARTVLLAWARYVDGGLLPNRFPDGGNPPDYNSVDASLWYFEALRAYEAATGDLLLLRDLFPVLADIADWYCRGTRYGIGRDSSDGLLRAGEPGLQLTWMDVKVDGWTPTPRTGKPVEVNALWCRALAMLAQTARRLGIYSAPYERLHEAAIAGFERFWNPELGYCYDVLDGPDGDDPTLRPNQIFAVSLGGNLLPRDRQQQVVAACEARLRTPCGLRSLDPGHPDYCGRYGGSPRDRDGAYHQGPVWGWLMGPFALARWRAFGDREGALADLADLAARLDDGCAGTLGEIFDGDPPHAGRGCFAQAWTVAETLRAWTAIAGTASRASQDTP